MKIRFSALLVLLLAGISLCGFAQPGKIIVFAPQGEKFTVFISGSMQNAEPAARVESDNPGGPSFKIRVVFPDPAIREISKLLFNKPQSTMYYKVGKNAKGVYILESTSSEWTAKADGTIQETPPRPQQDAPYPEKKETGTNEKAKSEQDRSTGAKGCDNPMNEPDFLIALGSISSQPFEGIQLSSAKKMAESHCLLVSQVKEVIYIFNLESSRLSFAKFAYEHTYNPEDYDQVKDALHSTKSKADLDKYLSAKTK